VGAVNLQDPDSTEHYAFNGGNPGFCEIYGRGTTWILGLESGLEWTLTPISGSALTSYPYPPKGYSVWFYYTGLPSSNSQFGEKTITLTHPQFPAGCNQDSQTVEVFFSRDATNNPGGDDPNWFYYWKGDNVVSDLSSFEYKLIPDAIGEYNMETGELFVSDGAQESKSEFSVTHKVRGDEWPIGANGEGIDCCAQVCAHELEHKWWHDNWSSFPDGDTDYVPDCQEGIPPFYFDPNDPDTYNMVLIYWKYGFYGDNEFLARFAEKITNPVYPSKDWSNENGKNW